ncbi:OmpA family protein [candidate division WOR-3 bacterium]|nr:OmpA family protein [candidate division WOR-3 bacterium]
MATLVHITMKRMKRLKIYFEGGMAYIHPRDQGVLDTLAAFMRHYPKNRFEIHGHTDPRSTAESNMELSYARASAVKDYLIKRGVDAERLKAVGFGETKPIAENFIDGVISQEGMTLNRRGEVVLIPPDREP